MPFITSLVLAAFVAYAGAWFMGAVEGNFAFLLFMASAVTGVYWLAERFYFLPARQAAVRRGLLRQRQQWPTSCRWIIALYDRTTQ